MIEITKLLPTSSIFVFFLFDFDFSGKVFLEEFNHFFVDVAYKRV